MRRIFPLSSPDNHFSAQPATNLLSSKNFHLVTFIYKKRRIFNAFVLREIPTEKQQKMFDHWKQKLEKICEYVQTRKEGELETKAEVIEHLVDSLLRDTLQKSVWLKVAGFNSKK